MITMKYPGLLTYANVPRQKLTMKLFIDLTSRLAKIL